MPYLATVGMRGRQFSAVQEEPGRGGAGSVSVSVTGADAISDVSRRHAGSIKVDTVPLPLYAALLEAKHPPRSGRHVTGYA